MVRDPQAALMALNRFGFGARGGAAGDLVNAASDPRGFVKADLQRPAAVRLEVPSLQPTPALAEAAFAYQAEVKQAREAARTNAKAAADVKPAPSSANMAAGGMSEKMASMNMPEKGNAAAPAQANETAAPNSPKPLNVIQKTFRAEALARLQRALQADCGFAERLVTFWSNHFCISAAKGPLGRMWAGSFERVAIRPHVFGRFSEMLTAVEQHPAMLFFLDNQQSLGPDCAPVKTASAASTKTSRAKSWNCIRSASAAVIPRPT